MNNASFSSEDTKETEEKTFCTAVNSILNELGADDGTAVAKVAGFKLGELLKSADAPQLSIGIELLFEKALGSEAFADQCAIVCKQCSIHVPPFKRQLLNKCQEVFEKMVEGVHFVSADWREAVMAGLDGTLQIPDLAKLVILYSADYSFGTLIFIGALYEQDMVVEKIMHEIVQHFLADLPSEELEPRLEAAVVLLLKIGKKLDHQRAQERLMVYFHRITKLSNGHGLCPRIKDKCNDLIVLRAQKWGRSRRPRA